MSDVLAAADRLENFYRPDDYDPTSCPGGLAAGGHRKNYIPSLRDQATVYRGTAATAKEVEQLAGDLRAATVSGGGLVVASKSDTVAGSLVDKIDVDGLEAAIVNQGGNEKLLLTAKPNTGAVLYLAQTCNAF